jgi:hypothetical protein
MLCSHKYLAIKPELVVETQEKLSLILCIMLLQLQFLVWLHSMIKNKDRFSKYAERQANKQIHMVKVKTFLLCLPLFRFSKSKNRKLVYS